VRALFALCVFVSFEALAQVHIENAWTRATPPGAKTAVGYLVIRNASAAPDRLVGGSSAIAARLETHVTLKDGDIMRMRQVKGYEIPAKGSLELKPGGAHLMFVDIKRPFKEGERIPAILSFEKAGEVRVDFHVGRLTASPPHGQHHKH
jgi:periplasmic copper chaperone A